LQYKDFSEWEASGVHADGLKNQEAYWLQKMAGKLPILHIPTDYPREDTTSIEGGTLNFKLDAPTSRQLKNMVTEEESTLFIMLMAIYSILLSRLTGQEELLLGTITPGRRHPDLQNIVGMFVNTMPLKIFPQGWKNFKDFLKEVKQNTLEAFENQDYPFEELVEKLRLRPEIGPRPIFNTMYTFYNLDFYSIDYVNEKTWKNPAQGIRFIPYPLEQRSALVDISLIGEEKGDQLQITFEYSTKLFKAETVQRFYGYFKEIVSAVLQDRNTSLKDILISYDLLEPEKENYRIDFAF
jgi:non-ribosomal peptide synthetase component F